MMSAPIKGMVVFQVVVAVLQVCLFVYLLSSVKRSSGGSQTTQQQEITRLKAYFNSGTSVNGSKEQAQLQLLMLDTLRDMNEGSTELGTQANRLAIAAVIFSVIQAGIAVLQLLRS